MSVKLDSRKYYMRRMRRYAEHLTRLIDLDAPDLILGKQLAMIIRAAEGLCGAEMYADLAEQRREVSRQRNGFCQDCDATCPPAETHPFLCERCEVKQKDDAEEFLRNAGIDPDAMDDLGESDGK